MGEIKIIAGKAKGKKIKSCKGLAVRPMLARIKKSLFDIIQYKLPDMECLDLFSGTGSIGLEAISRGAKSVTFVEKNSIPARTIQDNIKALGFEEQCKLINGDVLSIIKNINKQFDMIFLDPPFPEVVVKDILFFVFESNILKNNGIIVIHHPAYKSYVDTAGKLVCIKRAQYGQNILSFYSIDNNLAPLNSEGR